MHAKPNHSEVSLSLETIDLQPAWKSRLDHPRVVLPVHKKQIIPVLIHHRTSQGPRASVEQSLSCRIHSRKVSNELLKVKDAGNPARDPKNLARPVRRLAWKLNKTDAADARINSAFCKPIFWRCC
jgi:hypothetical protein